MQKKFLLFSLICSDLCASRSGLKKVSLEFLDGIFCSYSLNTSRERSLYRKIRRMLIAPDYEVRDRADVVFDYTQSHFSRSPLFFKMYVLAYVFKMAWDDSRFIYGSSRFVRAELLSMFYSWERTLKRKQHVYY